MKALTASDREAGIAGLALQERPYPHAAENDVIVRVHAAGFTTGELEWPGTWTDRAGRDRTPTIPGHEVAGVVVELGYGTTGLSVGQRVFGIADWTRDGSLAEYVAVETRNLAPLPADIDFVTAASLPISGLTAFQGLFVHGNIAAGQTVLVTGAAGGVGTAVCQLAREAGAYVIGAGRKQHKARILEAGADRFLNLDEDPSGEDDKVDLLFDVLDGPICARLTEQIRPGGALVSFAIPPDVSRADIDVRFFVVETDRQQLTDLITRVRTGRLRTFIGDIIPLEQAAEAFANGSTTPGKIVVKIAAD